jgi:hypothetical protein
MNNSDDDEILTFFVVIAAAALLGPMLLAHFSAAAIEKLISWHVIVDHGVLIPIGGGAGLDLARTGIAAGIFLLLFLIGFASVKHTVARRGAAKGGRA